MTAPVPVAFCENGAGFGGAVISLMAMLEQLDPRYTPLLYTSLGTEQYRQLAAQTSWRHLAPVDIVRRGWLYDRRVPFASMIDNVCNLLPYAFKYYRAFRRQGARIVYLNNDASCNVAAAMAARMAGLPLVLHARGFHADTRSNRLVLSWLDHCIPVSQAVKQQLVGLGVPEDKCTVVPEGLDLGVYRPRSPAARLRGELGLPADAPVITLVGGLIEWKGQDVLLEAAPAVFARYPNAHILLVGAAYGRDDVFARKVGELVQAPGVAGRVHLLGGRKDIPEILSISSVVVHASTQPEPFGRTFLEGMAVGRPVIASNEGGPLDVITHEVDGLLIAPRDPAVLAGAILRILDNPAWAAQMESAAAATAQRYSIQSHTKAITAVLERFA
ncbi:glycosyltransferase family 4 protein [Massilia sp. IC2-477]|uniref:glycosyltransferase family 4 protein n=1 Tax=unclassified Massilia TaxID=2609279 RepID=UPI001D1084F3|nr:MULTISPECIES: glycosyltransferase family 4 protein [unclassified Massilia]MCC2955051.1 glycosyltransferase family 4 protein [Massilia sp. IC2-477]MCC2973045.1 glycosyltransferase family 4 protein [Massilia sp. IC2-476]